MRKEYDFSGAVRGTHVARYLEGVSVIVSDDMEKAVEETVHRRKDSQLTELAGKHLVIAQLTAGGVEVAIPVRDRGIDLIAYVDIGGATQRFVACPIQLKVHVGRRFSLDMKYAKIKDLLLVYVWNVEEPESSDVYVMTYRQALQILVDKGFDHLLPGRMEGRTLSRFPINGCWN